MWFKKKKKEPVLTTEQVVLPEVPYEAVGESYRGTSFAKLHKSGVIPTEENEAYFSGYLEREPNNPHDKNAIGVYLGGYLVGYVSREDQKDVSSIMGKDRVLQIVLRLWSVYRENAWRARVTFYLDS